MLWRTRDKKILPATSSTRICNTRCLSQIASYDAAGNVCQALDGGRRKGNKKWGGGGGGGGRGGGGGGELGGMDAINALRANMAGQVIHPSIQLSIRYFLSVLG